MPKVIHLNKVAKLTETVSKVLAIDEQGTTGFKTGSDLLGKNYNFRIDPTHFEWTVPGTREVLDADGNPTGEKIAIAGIKYRNGSNGVNSFTAEQAATWEHCVVGKCSFAAGANNKSLTNYSSTFGSNNTNNGYGGFVAGNNNYAGGQYGITFGRNGTNNGDVATYVGESHTKYDNVILAMREKYGETYNLPKISAAATQTDVIDKVYAYWKDNKKFGAALGYYSFVGGVNSVAAAEGAFVIGERTFAKAQYAIATGQDSVASGVYSIVGGRNTKATGDAAVALGDGTIANGSRATAFGTSTIANGNNTIALGNGSEARGISSLAGGNTVLASGDCSFAFGCEHSTTQDGEPVIVKLKATGRGSFAVGEGTAATNEASAAFGIKTTSNGLGSAAFGVETVASGAYAIAAGNVSTASGKYALALGFKNTASGESSIAGGTTSVASGRDAMAIGNASKAYNRSSLAFGTAAYAGASDDTTNHSCISLGNYTTAKGVLGQVALGSGNKHLADAQLMVGNGTSKTKSNAFVVYTDGHAEVATNGDTPNSVVRNKELSTVTADLNSRIDTILGSFNNGLSATDISYVYSNIPEDNGVVNVYDALCYIIDNNVARIDTLSGSDDKSDWNVLYIGNAVHSASTQIEINDYYGDEYTYKVNEAANLLKLYITAPEGLKYTHINGCTAMCNNVDVYADEERNEEIGAQIISAVWDGSGVELRIDTSRGIPTVGKISINVF